MAKPKVHIFQPADETGESHKFLEAAGVEGKVPAASWIEASNQAETGEILELDPDTAVTVGIASRRTLLTPETIAGAPDLRLVAYYTVGFDNVDIDAATDAGVLVVHSPTEANWGGVAEGTMAFILSMLKKVRERDRHVKNGGWRDMSLGATYLGRRLDGYEGLTMGILGLGRIGSRVADLLGPWRTNIIACDPYVDQSKFVHHNATPVDIETLFRESDVLTIHCNLTKETMNLVNEKLLSLMKPTAILVNAARGRIVNIDDLFDALDKDKIAGAALDVLPEEPPEPQMALLGLGDKVILSPHMIAYTKGAGLKMAVPWVTENIMAALKGEVPSHICNEEALPKWRARFEGKSLL